MINLKVPRKNTDDKYYETNPQLSLSKIEEEKNYYTCSPEKVQESVKKSESQLFPRNCETTSFIEFEIDELCVI